MSNAFGPLSPRCIAAPLILALALARAASGQDGTSASEPSGGFRRAEKSISFVVNAAPAAAHALFGPKDEAKWADGWAPRFVFPADGSQGPDGAVFYTTSRSTSRVTTWIMPTFDAPHGKIDYFFLTPDYVTGELHIVVTAEGTARSRATVTYRYTALSETGNAFIAHWSEGFPKEAPHWAEAINSYLAGKGPHVPE